MNLRRAEFDDLMKVAQGCLGQSNQEWRCFLEFAGNYFRTREIPRPIVVEIGVMNNAQKPFYTELLNAEHIGIDVNYWSPGHPDIHGDSQNPGTFAQLQGRLAGRPIDLLFIDGDHFYPTVKADYEIYGPLTKHIIALHDISGSYDSLGRDDVMRLWKEIAETDTDNLLLTIRRYNSLKAGITAGYQMGIGLVVRESA